MTEQSNYSVALLAALLFSVILIASAIGILIWALGWKVLLVLVVAFLVFVALLVARDVIVEYRTRK